MELDKLVGVIIDRKETDYVLGSSPVAKEVLMPNLDWKKWTAEHERQNEIIETLMCVSFSATDIIEYLFTHALHNNKISADNVKWLTDNGYFKNGFINFSDRFVGTLGETREYGAYQNKVADAIRKFGLIPQDMLPIAGNFKDNIDLKFITKEMYELGAEFIKRFPINYEWVNDVKEGLKYAPLQVCVYYQDGEGILCPGQNPQHAVVAVNATNDFVEIDDSYRVQFKKYCYKSIWSPMLYTVKFNNNMFTFKKVKGEPHIYLVNDIRKTRTMLVDMETLESLQGSFIEVDSLSEYKDDGTLVWVNRIIN